MDAFFHALARIMTVTFALGVAGCLVTIPIVAWKFFSVLLEKDAEPGDEARQQTTAE
jgi:hypothetical protein